MTRTATTVDAGREAWELLVALVFSHRQRVIEAASREGLTPGHAMALMNLDAADPRPMRRLGEQLRCDPSYLTGVVDRLEELGLVERRPSPADRRVKELVVTSKGAEAQGRLRAGWMEPPAALDELSATDRQTLRRIVRRLTGASDMTDLPPFAKPPNLR